jgi:hypothetical protein
VTEPDYVVHLIRAEEALKAVYPAMCDKKVKEALVHVQEVVMELAQFVIWVLTHKAKS